MTKGPEKRDRMLSLRLSSTTLEQLREVAMYDQRSMSDWALLAVQSAIKRAQAKMAKAASKTGPK